MLWNFRRCALRVHNRGAQANARPAMRAQASTVKKDAVRKVFGARQHPATIDDNTKALRELFSRLTGSRAALDSTGKEGLAYVMRVDNRARGNLCRGHAGRAKSLRRATTL
jgi:hypothetical protein